MPWVLWKINSKTKKFTNHSSNFNNNDIYKTSWSCGKCYIGQTNQNILTRFKEHISDIKLKKKLISILSLANTFWRIII